MLHKTLRFHGISSQLNPKGYPLPHKTKGGADLIVSHAGKVFAIDVAIAKEKLATETTERVDHVFNAKMRNYEEFHNLTNFTIVPFVLSVYGVLSPQTIELIKEWWKYPFVDLLLRDALFSNIQFALIRGLIFGHDAKVQHVHPNPSALSHPTFPQPTPSPRPAHH